MQKRAVLNENITHSDLLNMDFDKLAVLSDEIREFLIGVRFQNGRPSGIQLRRCGAHGDASPLF